MPSVFGGNGSSPSGITTGGYVSPSSSANATASANASSAGKISVNLFDPQKTIGSSAQNLDAGFIGLGKGLVSIVQNLPVVGAIAKPLIGIAGGIADATIGQGVSALEKIKVGDTNVAQAGVKALEMVGAPLAMGMDLISAPSRIIEQRIAEARIKSAQSGQSDWVTGVFGNAPKQAMDMIRNGSSVEEAALQLANSNAGFSENGAMNFLYSLVLDPMNLIAPGAGKIAAVGKDAAYLAKIGESTLLNLSKDARAINDIKLADSYAKQAEFLSKYNIVGKFYDATLGMASRVTKRFTSNIVKEVATGWTRTYNVGVIENFFTDIRKATGLNGASFIETGLKNHAATMMNAVKSGSIRAITAIQRSVSQDFADKFIKNAYDFIKSGGTKEEFLALPAARGGTAGGLLKDLGVPEENINNLFSTISDLAPKNLNYSEVAKKSSIMDSRNVISTLDSNAYIAQKQDLIRKTAEYKSGLDARTNAEDAIRVIREAKLERVAAASNPAIGIPQLAQDIAAGFGIDVQAAQKIAEEQFAKHAGNVKDLTDILSMARGASFGQAMRELAVVRSQFKVSDTFSKLTIISSRSLTTEEAFKIGKQIDTLKAGLSQAIKDGDNVAKIAFEKALDEQASSLVNRFDEFARFAGNAYTTEEVLNYLKKGAGITVRELSKADALRIATEKSGEISNVARLQAQLEKYGYRLGVAPESGLSNVTTLASDHLGREKVVQMTMPFSDTLDHLPNATSNFDIGVMDKALLQERMQPTRLSKIWDAATRGYGAEITKGNVIERFVTSMVQKTGISVNDARSIMAQVSSLAAEKGLRPQALFMDKVQVEDIFQKVMGDNYSKLLNSGSDPIKEIISAAAGDWSVAGLTSGFTGRIKALRPEITLLTDRIYPEVRFGKLNPYFNLVLERIETRFMNITHGIMKENAIAFLGEHRGTVLRRGHLDPRNVSREINDNVQFVREAAVRNTASAVIQSPSFARRVADTIRPLFTKQNAKDLLSIDGVREAKQVARDIMTDQFASREFMNYLDKVAPGKIQELAVHFGTTNAKDTVQLLLEEYLIQSDPILFAKHVAEQGKVGREIAASVLERGGLTAKQSEDIAAATYAAYETAMLRGSRAADKAQYFASHRSWLERSLNHPFLGLYPYSYAVQKAIPSMLRFFFLPRYGGKVWPGWNYSKFEIVAEYMNNQTNTNPDLIKQMVQNDAILYVFQTILPTTPDSMGFSMPAWLRRGVIQPGITGVPINPGSIGATLSEIGSTVVRGTALGQINTTLKGVQGVQDITNVNQNLGDFIQTTTQDIQKKIQDQVSQIRQP